ncbi:MAG TPA: hypothetical protein VFO65_07140, partial [Acidimicrobiales bacterium]|nr:hypothetical protein [Acidimicrobiales bacterium]
SLGPAGAAGHRAVGTLLAVGPGAALLAWPPAATAPAPAGAGPRGDGAQLAWSPLAADAVLVSAVAPTAAALRRALDAALDALAGAAGPAGAAGR